MHMYVYFFKWSFLILILICRQNFFYADISLIILITNYNYIVYKNISFLII